MNKFYPVLPEFQVNITLFGRSLGAARLSFWYRCNVWMVMRVE